MRKRMIFLVGGFFLLSVLLFAVGACSTGPEKPGEVTVALIKAIENGDNEKAMSFMSEKTEIYWTEEGGLKEAREELESQEGIKNIEILNETFKSDESAGVEFKLIFGNGESETVEWDFVKEDGKWKLSFY